MFRGRYIHYEGGDRLRGLGAGGIGAMHLLARRTGLTAAIDERLRLLKVHQPYHESDHVLNLAYNILCGGRTLEDLEQVSGTGTGATVNPGCPSVDCWGSGVQRRATPSRLTMCMGRWRHIGSSPRTCSRGPRR